MHSKLGNLPPKAFEQQSAIKQPIVVSGKTLPTHFRQDLFYRLNVIPIRLPSLAERPEDIRLQAQHFLSKTNQQNQCNVHLTAQALEALEEQVWPGNIRELANVIERTVLLTDQSTVSRRETETWLPDAKKAKDGSRAAAPAWPLPLDQCAPPMRDYQPRNSHDERELRKAMELQDGNQSLGFTAHPFSNRWKRVTA